MTQSHDPAAPFRHALIDVHSNYRGQRLAHEPPDELVSEQVTLRVRRPYSVTREGVQAAILQPPIPEDAARAQLDQLRELGGDGRPAYAGYPAQTAQFTPRYPQQQSPPA